MKIKLKRMKKIFFVFPLILTAPSIISCSVNANSFYLANFQSYISEDLLDTLHSEYDDFNFRSYATNEHLENKFPANYDIAIPSGYLISKMANNGYLEPIDWSKFDLYMLDENGNRTNKKIETAADALTLFTPNVRSILTEVYYLKDFPDPDSGGLLNYCVPYFIQDFIFSYNNPNEFPIQNENKIKWSNILSYAGENIGENKDINKIIAIDDYRSLYSIVRLIQTENDEFPTVNPGNANTTPNKPINPGVNKNFDKSYFYEAFSLLKKYFKQRNSFVLNSDSNLVLNDLANIKGSKASILYNGDALYAYQGGDSYTVSDEIFHNWLVSNFSGENFNYHTIRPEQTLNVLDALVINKNSKQKDKAYEIIKKIALEGADISLYNSSNNYNPESIIKVDDQNNFFYGPMQNFDYVQYSSPLLNINTYVLNSFEKIGGIGGYFTDLYRYLLDEKILTKKQYENYIYSLYDVYKIESKGTSNNMLEQNLSDLNKSNMYYAFQEIKYEI